MGASPSRSTLYRSLWWLVIPAALVLLLHRVSPGQASRTKANKEPRAIGVLELLPGGKARLIPVAIRIDGEFYDASAYKASPVPMALWSDVVYEGFHTGVSQGLFTVNVALQNQRTNEWMGQGTWQTTAELEAKTKKKAAPAEPLGLNDDEGPPVLRHSGSAKPKPPEGPPAVAPAPATPAATATPVTPSAPAAAPAPSSPAPTPEDKTAPVVLKRGIPTSSPEDPVDQTQISLAKPPTRPALAPKTQVQLIPAISDTLPSDSRSYAYDLKPDELEQLKKKMLALAADEIRAKIKQPDPHPNSAAKTKTAARRKTQLPQPDFQDVDVHVFDLSGNNEPSLVLTATAAMPHSHDDSTATADTQFMITLIEREDVNGEFHKALANVTDAGHLDVLPRLDLIDAVDADGDGRGELLFRQVSDAGSAFVIYRLIGDQLYPLFQGKLP